jgi:branched-subunit amino acid aminotransferase/4-amino-4-deoxychorismate lyase
MSPQLQAWCWTDGAFRSCDTVPVWDRGFRYGMSVFESIRVRRGVPLFFAEHAERLRHACADREFRVEDRAIAAAEGALRGTERDGFARLYVTAGDGTVATAAEHPRVFLMLEDRERPAPKAYALAIPHEPHPSLFGGLKTANYWSRIDVLQRALRHGKDEALLFNEHAELVSACMANVFVVHAGSVRTPALACGARNGVVRAWTLQRTGAKECSLFVEDLQTADEVFLTNTWLGIQPVGSVENRALPAQTVSAGLAAAYEQAIAGLT